MITRCENCGVPLGPNDRHRFEKNDEKYFDLCRVCCPNCFGGSGIGSWKEEENTNG